MERLKRVFSQKSSSKSRRKWPLEEIKVNNVDEKTLCEAFRRFNGHLKLSDEQKRSFFEVRNNINCILKNRSNNVKVVIYIDDQDIPIIAGNAENHINFYIKSDASYKKEWIKRKEDDDLKYEIDTKKVDARTVHDEIQKFKHKFEGDEKQKQALYKVRDEIDGLVSFGSNNIRFSLFVDDVLPEPIVFKAGKEENQLCIYINSDGTHSCVWEKKTFGKKCIDNCKSVIFSETFRNFASSVPGLGLLIARPHF